MFGVKRFVAMFTAAVLFLFGFQACSAEKILSREDIPIAETELQALYELGIMTGTDKGMEPDRQLTRAEALTLIERTTGVTFPAYSLSERPFDDIEGHWAENTILKFYAKGLVAGRGNKAFDPDATVTGREFVKILLSTMGYENITIENAYEKGVEVRLLNDNFTKSLVSENYSLLRSDAARLCFSALTALTPSGKMLYKNLIDLGKFDKDAFDGVLYISCEDEASFADRLNAEMPKDKNYMFSPLSIKLAFAMAANGAEGETRAEILNTFGIDDLDSFNSEAEDMISRYAKSDFLKLNISNSIWINESMTDQKFSDTYRQTIGEFYHGEAKTVTNENAVKAVNGWVDEKTNGRIDKIINDSNFWACLINAIYFKASWKGEFHEGATSADEFTCVDGAKIQKDFMHKTSYFDYGDADGVQMIRLPYSGRNEKFSEDGKYLGTDDSGLNISMYVILGDSLVENPVGLINNTKLENRYVALSLPKFETEYSQDIAGIMKALGINRAFNGDAEFEKMFDKGTMFINKVLHKTYITVDEKGTEAAAVTALLFKGTGFAPQPEPVEMNVNRPFTYVIMDDGSGEALFVGSYCGRE